MVDAIPFDFQLLTDKLNKNSGIILEKILEWFENDNRVLKWNAGHLFSIIFPKIDGDIQDKLIQIIRTKDISKLDSLLQFLDNYKGSSDVLEIVKEIIKNFEVSSELKSRLKVVLSHIGAFTGEYGLVKAYEKKIEDIKSWKDDPNESVSSFAKFYITYLQNSIKYEKARVEEEIDSRRIEFDRFTTTGSSQTD